MLGVVYFSVIILNVIMALCGRKSKFVTIFTMVFILLFVAGVRYNGSVVGYDLRNYALHYSDPSLISTAEVGYRMINHLGRLCGLTFEQFYMALTTTCLLFIFRAAKKIGSNMHMFFAAYMLYFVGCHSSQLRNLCAFAVFINLFPFYPQKIEKNVRLFLGILLATTFHVSYCLYFLLFIAKSSKGQKFTKTLYGILISVCILLVISNQSAVIGRFFSPILSMLGDVGDKYSKYTETATGLSPLASIAILAVCVWLLHFRKRAYIGSESDSLTGVVQSNTMFMIRVCYVSACFVPLLLMNATLYRFIRDITLVGIAHICSNVSIAHFRRRKRTMLVFGVIAISIGWIIFDTVLKGYWENFIDNYFINAILKF